MALALEGQGRRAADGRAAAGILAAAEAGVRPVFMVQSGGSVRHPRRRWTVASQPLLAPERRPSSRLASKAEAQPLAGWGLLAQSAGVLLQLLYAGQRRDGSQAQGGCHVAAPVQAMWRRRAGRGGGDTGGRESGRDGSTGVRFVRGPWLSPRPRPCGRTVEDGQAVPRASVGGVEQSRGVGDARAISDGDTGACENHGAGGRRVAGPDWRTDWQWRAGKYWRTEIRWRHTYYGGGDTSACAVG